MFGSRSGGLRFANPPYTFPSSQHGQRADAVAVADLAAEHRIVELVFEHLRGAHRALRECAVLDLSDSGACVIVASTTDLPDTFELTTDRDGLTRECKVIWRRGNRIGLSFRGSPRVFWRA